MYSRNALILDKEDQCSFRNAHVFLWNGCSFLDNTHVFFSRFVLKSFLITTVLKSVHLLMMVRGGSFWRPTICSLWTIVWDIFMCALQKHIKTSFNRFYKASLCTCNICVIWAEYIVLIIQKWSCQSNVMV